MRKFTNEELSKLCKISGEKIHTKGNSLLCTTISTHFASYQLLLNRRNLRDVLPLKSMVEKGFYYHIPRAVFFSKCIDSFEMHGHVMENFINYLISLGTIFVNTESTVPTGVLLNRSNEVFYLWFGYNALVRDLELMYNKEMLSKDDMQTVSEHMNILAGQSELYDADIDTIIERVDAAIECLLLKTVTKKGDKNDKK